MGKQDYKCVIVGFERLHKDLDTLKDKYMKRLISLQDYIRQQEKEIEELKEKAKSAETTK